MNFKLSYAVFACLALTAMTSALPAPVPANSNDKSIPSMSQLRSGRTSYRFESNDKTWHDTKSNTVLKEENNHVRVLTSGVSMDTASRRENGNTVSSSSPFAPSQNLRPMAPSGSWEGGIGFFNDAAATKKAINDGVASVLGQDKYAQALAQGAASLETGFGNDMPTEQDQRAHGKLNTDRQEFGPMRVNRNLLRGLGYQESQMWKMNEYSYQGRKLAAEAFAKALKTYGLNNFMHYQRGGESRYQRAKAGTLWGGEAEDTAKLLHTYQQNQVTLLNNDLYKQNSNQVAWTFGPYRM